MSNCTELVFAAADFANKDSLRYTRTRSLVPRMRSRRVKPLPIGQAAGAQEALLTPSAIFIEDDRIYFGPQALKRAAGNSSDRESSAEVEQRNELVGTGCGN